MSALAGLVVPPIEDTTSTLTAALAYAECGWYVLPIAPGGKHAGSRVGTGWPAKSSRDPQQITAWFAGCADGIALHVGRSGGVVFDIDAPDALPEVLARHLDIAPYQATRDDQPGRGHYIFAAPPGRLLGNGTGELTGGWGEIRGTNGIIVAAPSAHAAPGGRYHWIRTGPVPQLPEKLATMLPDGSPGEDAATDAVVHAFLAEHTGTSNPGLLSAVLADFGRRLDAGQSRHDAAVIAACWAMRESAAGYYPAADAADRLRAAFLGSVATARPGSSRGAGDPLATAEWTSILAWAIGQARATDPAITREQVESRTELATLTAAPSPPNGPLPGETTPDDEPPALVFQTLAELIAEVDAAGPRRWLLRGVWPAGDYGVHAAEKKAQKTWNTADVAVSTASGTPWLGAIEVDDPGPVLMFVGEGGKANHVRRLRAVAEARGVVAESLPIVVYARAPRLSNDHHMQLFAAEVAARRPVLVTLDPLYLSAAGANLADLYAMGALLERPQRLCQAAGASLWIVTHYNRKQGSGAGRITGAGPAEWGRVLISAEVKSRRTDPGTRASDVVSVLEIIGGEVPDRELTLHRRIWSDDPDDLDAPLHLECTVTEHDAPEDSESGAGAKPQKFAPAVEKMLEALQEATGPRTVTELVDSVAKRYGHGLKRQTASTALNTLERAGLAESIDCDPGRPKDWVRVDRDEGNTAGQTRQHVSLTRHR